MKYKVVKYDKIGNSKWDAFVDQSDEAWFWHKLDFFDAWPYGENCSFCIVDEKNEIVLIQMLLIERREKKKCIRVKRFHGIPYIGKYMWGGSSLSSIGGLARKNGLTIKEERNISRVYMEYMDNLILEESVSDFNYSIQATLSKRYFPSVCPLVNPLIFFGYQNSMKQSYIIDMSADLEDIFRGYSQTTRNLIYRCQRDEKIRIVEAQPIENDLNIYYNLHVETYSRTGVTPHPKAYFEHIFFEILKKGYCHILFCYREERPIAAHNILIYKDSAMYWTGCSASDKGDGESRLLMHEQIIYAKDKGAQYFEVGEAFPNIRYGKLKGLNDFKKSFGGQLHPIFSGAYLIQ